MKAIGMTALYAGPVWNTRVIRPSEPVTWESMHDMREMEEILEDVGEQGIFAWLDTHPAFVLAAAGYTGLVALAWLRISFVLGAA